MSISTILSVPKNDNELNSVIASFNAAYDKYFDAGVSSKRSDKLRDCICEGLGFTNGGYQELQASWDAQMGYDFHDPDAVIGLVSERTGGYQCVLSKMIAVAVIEFLCKHFPLSGQGKLLLESEFPDEQEFSEGCTWEDYGWDLLQHNDGHNSVIKAHRESGQWFPLYYGQVIIGYAFNLEEASVINAMLRSAASNKLIKLSGMGTGNRGDLKYSIQWGSYMTDNLENIGLTKGKYLSLRKEGMSMGILIPFTNVQINENKLTVKYGGKTFDIDHNKDRDVVTYNGLEFDFINLYTFGGGFLSIAQGKFGKGDDWIFSAPIREDIEFVEWFAYDRIDYREEDSDCDEIREITNLKNNAFLIK